MAKVDSFGVNLQIEDPASAGTYVDIAQVADISGPGKTRSTTDVTTHDSSNGYREFIAGLKEGKPVTFDLQWDPDDTASHADLDTVFESGDLTNFRLIFPVTSNARLEFTAIVDDLGEIESPVEGSLTRSCSLKVSGKPTLNQSPS